jgi:hypothetical protein
VLKTRTKVQKCTHGHPRAKPISFLECDRDGFVFCTIAFQASTPNFLRRGFCVHALCRERGTRTSRIAISGKIYDFFATRAKVKKSRRSIVRMPYNCNRAKFRAQTYIARGGDRFRARVLARNCFRVFLVTSTFFRWFS